MVLVGLWKIEVKKGLLCLWDSVILRVLDYKGDLPLGSNLGSWTLREGPDLGHLPRSRGSYLLKS